MLLEMVLTPIFMLLQGLIELIPDNTISEDFDISGLLELIKNAFTVFPYDLFSLIIGNVVFWLEVQFIWAIIEWVYKKVPGVD